MPNSLPLTLVIAFTLFLGFGAEQQRHLRHFQGRSQSTLHALNLSVFLATITAIGLLVYYGMQTSWYWPIILFMLALVIGPIIFGFVARSLGTMGTPVISMLGFAGWPAAAVWTFFITRQMHP